MTPEYSSAEEQKKVFNLMAEGWYGFRHRTIFRHELTELAKRWQKGKLLNIGCGHGADFIPFKDNFELHGLDFSPGMIEMAHKYAAKFAFEAKLEVADARHLPYPDESFNWGMAVAVYHHLENKQSRLEALKELRRVLKPEGEAFITAWNRWQPRFWFKQKDAAIPWKSKEKTLMRYYHLFSYGEFEKLAKEAGFKVIKSFPEKSHRFPFKFFSRNICLLLKK